MWTVEYLTKAAKKERDELPADMRAHLYRIW